MQGCNPLSFLPTKKKQAEEVDVDGHMSPFFSSSWMYDFKA